MSIRRNGWLAGAVAFAGGLFALLSLEWVAVGVVAALLVTGLFVKRIELDRIGQLIAVLFCLAGAYLLTIVIGVSGEKHPPGSISALGAAAALFFLLVAVTRMCIRNPWLGDRGTAGLALFAVLSCGEVGRGLLYPIGALVTLGLAVLALRAADPGRPSLSAMTPRHRLASGVIIALSVGIAAALVVSLPLAYRWAFQAFESSFFAPRTGFSAFLRLGTFDVLEQSDTVVLRIYGNRPDHLRGAVYTRYRDRRWLGKKGDRPVTLVLPSRPNSQVSSTEIFSVSGDRDRYFIPLAAAGIEVSEGRARADGTGIVFSAEEGSAERVHFVASDRDRPMVSRPGAEELAIPDELLPAITALARQWAGVNNGPAALDAISDHLKRNFTYSLSFQQTSRGDPLLAFLTEVRAGHCEYFASALALLGRAVEIPTRVVSGYRVQERNPFGDYYIVREWDAHSWIEAWIPGEGWRTYDPTPPAELFAGRSAESPILAGLADGIAAGLSGLGRRLAELTVGQIGLTLVALVLFWFGVRLVRRLRGKSRKKRTVRIRYGEPLPAAIRLIDALARRGEPLRTGEPLEHYAARLALSPRLGPAATDAAALLNQYAAWRYGKRGDEQGLTRRIDEWLS